MPSGSQFGIRQRRLCGRQPAPAESGRRNNASSPFVEALRGLRGQLMLRWFDGTPGQSALSITSVDRGDGKSFIVANLGVVFAQLGEQTLIVDADLRHPTQHKIFNVKNRMGLSGVLSGRANLEEIVPVPGVQNLSVLPSGPLPPTRKNCSVVPSSVRLLDVFSTRYNVILVDTPSAQEASDAHVVAQRTRGVIPSAKGQDQEFRTRSAGRYFLRFRRPDPWRNAEYHLAASAGMFVLDREHTIARVPQTRAGRGDVPFSCSLQYSAVSSSGRAISC